MHFLVVHYIIIIIIINAGSDLLSLPDTQPPAGLNQYSASNSQPEVPTTQEQVGYNIWLSDFPWGYFNKPPPLLIVCGDKSGRPTRIKVEQAMAKNTTFHLWWAGVPDITNTPTGKNRNPEGLEECMCCHSLWVHTYSSQGPEMLLLWHHPPPMALTSSTASSGEIPEPWGRGLVKTALLREEENGIPPPPKRELSYKMLRNTNWA